MVWISPPFLPAKAERGVLSLPDVQTVVGKSARSLPSTLSALLLRGLHAIRKP